MLAAVTAITKLDFYCRVAPEIHVYSDCATLVNITKKDFSEISKTRLLRLLEKISNYNLEFHHLPGCRNSISDYLSRYPCSSPPIDDLPSDPVFVSNRSLRTVESNVATKDPMVINLAEMGETDPGYCELIQQISGNIRKIGKDSDYLNCKPLLPFLSTAEVGNGKQIVVHNDTEILVPVNGRKELVDTLQSTHMATDTMVRASKGKFLWPGMKNDLHKKYKGGF